MLIPPSNSDHQEYYILVLVGDPIHLHFPLILGKEHPKQGHFASILMYIVAGLGGGE